MVGKQVRGKYTQEYKTEAVRQALSSQSLTVTAQVWASPRPLWATGFGRHPRGNCPVPKQVKSLWWSRPSKWNCHACAPRWPA